MFEFNGYLPYFLLFTSLLASIHSITCYVVPPSTSMRLFSGPAHPPHTSLLARVYGIKNIYTSAIRAYAALHIENGALYNLAMLTYVGVLWLFMTEIWVWRTVRVREAVFSFLLAGTALCWMTLARDWYVRD